jgi:hypothetical protein
MSVALCWFAVRGWARDAALEELGLEADGAPGDDLPRRIGVADLPDGWLLFMFNRDLKQAFEDRFVALSARGPAVACAIEEHVMYQEARGYEAGAEVWRVTHDPQQGDSVYHLEVTGAPPAQLSEIREAAVAEQDEEGGEDAGADFVSDVPLDLAASICGFKHDDDWPQGGFTELRRANSPSAEPKAGGGPGFLQRLFGRR